MSHMNGTSEVNLPPNSQFLQQQRKTLLDYLASSLEARELANAFDEIERICLVLVQHSQNSLEKTILKDLMSRLPSFKGVRSTTKSTIENLDARRKFLSGKKADVGSRLGQGRGQLSSHEAKYSVLSEEESRLRAEVLTTTSQENVNSEITISSLFRRLIVSIEGEELLCLYLNVPDACSLPDGWYRDVESFSLTIVNQICPKDSMEASSTEARFDEESPGWGFGEFTSLSEIHSPDKGFLVGDTLVIEVRVSVTSSSYDDDLIRSKNLLEELTHMIETSESNLLPLNSQFLQQQRKTLLKYLALSLEDGELANAFDEIEGISLVLLQHSQNSFEKTILKDLVSRLPAFKGIRSTTMSTIENLDARRKALSGKRADVWSRLGQGQGQLRSHEAKCSVLSEEELKLDAEILCLNTQKQEFLARKEAMAHDRKSTNDEVSISLKEWKDVGKETEEIDQDWLKAGEELARANLSWKLFHQNLELIVKVGNAVK